MDETFQNHEPYISKTITMAQAATDRGDRPCGSLLVADDEIIREDTNRVYSDDDLALHPELSLTRWAERELRTDEQAETVLYTTVEPCSMCATAIALTELGSVVFSVSGDEYWSVAADAGYDVPTDYIPCAEVFERLGAETTIVDSVCATEGIETIQACLEGQ